MDRANLHRKMRRLGIGRPGEAVDDGAGDAAEDGDDESVSRRHARVSVEQDVASIEDLGSTNGTLLNREPLDSVAVLRDGDVVDVGSLQLTFRTLSNTAARTKRLRR